MGIPHLYVAYMYKGCVQGARLQARKGVKENYNCKLLSHNFNLSLTAGLAFKATILSSSSSRSMIFH